MDFNSGAYHLGKGLVIGVVVTLLMNLLILPGYFRIWSGIVGDSILKSGTNDLHDEAAQDLLVIKKTGALWGLAAMLTYFAFQWKC